MARAIRLEYAGAVYHVMARGNQGQKICADDADRKMWLASVGEACRRTGWRVHAWVLMPNHYHLLLETPEANLVNGMKWLQGSYTQRYNTRHRKRGHSFQGRYRAVPVAGEPDYFQTVSTYIHLNSARAKLIRIEEQKLWEYRWSSYPEYVRGERAEWLETVRVLASVGLGPEEREGYRAYQESRVLELGIKAGRKEWEAGWRALRRGWYVGDEAFGRGLLGRVKAAVRGRRRGSQGGECRRAHDVAEAEGMLKRGLAVLRVPQAVLAKTPKGQVEKQVLAWWLCERTTVTRRWVAERLHMGHESRVAQALAGVRRASDPLVVKMKGRLSRAFE